MLNGLDQANQAQIKTDNLTHYQYQQPESYQSKLIKEKQAASLIDKKQQKQSSMESHTDTKRYRLNNKNYATWATMMRAEMYSSGGLALIKREAVADIEEKNMKLYILIMKHLDEEHIAIVNSELGPEKEGNGLELWEMLKKEVCGK